MALLGPTSALSAVAFRPPVELAAAREALASRPSAPAGPAGAGFGEMFEKMVGEVEQRQAESAAVTRSVLLGENPHLHQSILAMQEASVSFSLMVEVRNKVIEGYQELMRMPV